MNATERRKEIAALLISENHPVTGGQLSDLFHVSRQIIVQDIAFLKTAGYEIFSTHNGYVIKASPLNLKERIFKVRHTSDQTFDELSTIVSLNGIVADVFVWHKVYGKIRADLNIFSHHGIEKFLDGIKSGKSTELMHITSGYHYHTVRAESEEILDQIASSLKEKNYIVPEL